MAQPLRRRTLLQAAAALGLAAAAPWVHARRSKPLRFAWWGGSARHEATLRAVRLFEQRSGLRVKAEYMGFNGYLERLTTQIAGRAEPDLVQINWAWLAMFSKRGTGFTELRQHAHLLKLDEFGADDLATGDIAGRLNALPLSYSARIMLWNAATWERLGLALPADWDRLFEAGAVFRQRMGEGAFPLDGELYDMILLAQAWVQQRHGTAYIAPGADAQVAMSPAAALDWVRTYRRLVESHVAVPLPLRASLGGAEKPTEQQPDWVTGRWAGNYTWDALIALRASTLNPQQRLALGAFPTLPGAKDSGMFGRPTLMYAVSRHSRQPEGAVQLMNFLLTDLEAARLLGRTRGLPMARGPLALLQDEGRLPALELQAHAQIAAQREASRLALPAPLFEHPRMLRFLREVFELVAYRKTTDEAAAERLVRQGQALLQRLK
jgi:oligogalacturonide transport system substrate-binding protein